MDSENKIAVIGLGNVLLQDEGVGIHVINRLLKEFAFSPKIDLIDGGTAGFDLLPFFENKDKVIVIDAINFDMEPGFIGSYTNDEILRRFNRKSSLHHLGLADVLSDLMLHNVCPDEIYLLGIQPQMINSEVALSPLIYAKLDDLLKIILIKLSEWNIQYKRLGYTKSVNIKATPTIFDY